MGTVVAGTTGTGARVTQRGAVWVVEMEQAGGKVQRFECATEAMAVQMQRMLERTVSRGGR